jgi:hypothetical protein
MTKIRTKLLSALFATASIGAVGVAGVVGATPAHAADNLCSVKFPGDSSCEYDVATDMGSGGPQISEPCASTESGAKVCFVKYGDYLWVYDGRSDGRSAVAVWEVPAEGRHGICRNMSGSGHWARCNKNFQENRTINFYAVKYDGETNSFSDPSEWESSSTGPAN